MRGMLHRGVWRMKAAIIELVSALDRAQSKISRGRPFGELKGEKFAAVMAICMCRQSLRRLFLSKKEKIIEAISSPMG